jgi:alkanesulfonate monooxygenase SsuD/methylene tetrahydromethanopterin reductase-like flavin-dependent oxidoreductase (luciferase family)
LKFGVITANFNSPKRIVELAKTAEEVGFDHLLLSDHYYLEQFPDMLDPWALIGNLTGQTSTLRLGTCVTPITFRPPLQFAKVVTTLDHISNGRLIVGVGAGWGKAEFEMFSKFYPDKERFAQFLEALELLGKAWTEKQVNFAGKYYTVSDAVVEPKPIQKPTPPLLFGGWGKKMVRLAGEKGNGWTPTGPRSGNAVKSPEHYAKFIQTIDAGLGKRGLSHDAFQFGCRFGLLERREEQLHEIESFASKGLNCYQLGVWADEHSSEALKRFADTVMANF